MSKTKPLVPDWKAQLTPAQVKTRNAQLGRIHCIARELGWVGDDKELLRMQVDIATGSDSLSELNIAQLGRVLDRLKLVLGTHRGRAAKLESAAHNIIQLPTPAMREHANALLAELVPLCGIRNPGGYLEGVAQKRCGKPLDRLNRREFGSVIEALKKIRSRF